MDRCADHSGHIARIEALEKRQVIHEEDSNKVRARLFDSIEDLKKNYLGEALSRLPNWGTALITILTSISSALTVYFLTRG